MAFRLTRRARTDLLNIWRYIAEDSEPAADRFIDLLTHHFHLLGNNPMPAALRTSCGQAIAASR